MSPCGHSVAVHTTEAGFGRLGRGLECCCSHGDHEPHHTACLRGKARLTCAADIGNRTSESSRGCGRAEGPGPQLDRAPLFV